MTVKSGLKSVRRAVALEPRLLFDASVGAAADPGADAFFDETSKQTEQSGHGSKDGTGLSEMGYRFWAAMGVGLEGSEPSLHTDTEGKPAILVGEDTSKDTPVLIGEKSI